MAEMGETLCHDCSGACCRENVVLQLSISEKKTLEEAGSQLGGYILELFPEDAELIGTVYKSYEEYCDAKVYELQPKHWFSRIGAVAHQARNLLKNREEGMYPYVFEEDCAFLDTSAEPPVCSVYDDPSRPQACGELAPAGRACKEIRKASPHAVPVHITPRGEMP